MHEYILTYYVDIPYKIHNFNLYSCTPLYQLQENKTTNTEDRLRSLYIMRFGLQISLSDDRGNNDCTDSK